MYGAGTPEPNFFVDKCGSMCQDVNICKNKGKRMKAIARLVIAAPNGSPLKAIESIDHIIETALTGAGYDAETLKLIMSKAQEVLPRHNIPSLSEVVDLIGSKATGLLDRYVIENNGDGELTFKIFDSVFCKNLNDCEKGNKHCMYCGNQKAIDRLHNASAAIESAILERMGRTINNKPKE